MKNILRQVITELEKTEHGFKHIQDAGTNLLQADPDHAFTTAEMLLAEPGYQARMLAVFLLGEIASGNPAAMHLLKTQVATDENWRVQEMLAKAFDTYCKQIGYEASLPEIKLWLTDENPNLNRAAVEGLRIWTSRPYFKDHPEVAIDLIASLKSSDSEYVRKSVGNALRDISKKHATLVEDEVAGWDQSDKHIAFTQKLVFNRKPK